MPSDNAAPRAYDEGLGRLLTPAEVAAMFRVDPKTVTRWAKSGRLGCIRTIGGHRRYRLDEIKRHLESEPEA